jgi:hypothetical protein
VATLETMKNAFFFPIMKKEIGPTRSITCIISCMTVISWSCNKTRTDRYDICRARLGARLSVWPVVGHRCCLISIQRRWRVAKQRSINAGSLLVRIRVRIGIRFGVRFGAKGELQ